MFKNVIRISKGQRERIKGGEIIAKIFPEWKRTPNKGPHQN